MAIHFPRGSLDFESNENIKVLSIKQRLPKESSLPGGWRNMHLTRQRPNPRELMNALTRMINFQIIAVPGAVQEVIYFFVFPSKGKHSLTLIAKHLTSRKR